jgi:SAM-dependent methyltransferase
MPARPCRVAKSVAICVAGELKTMNDPIVQQYDEFYRKRNPNHVYPVEFVVRAFLGNYPRHRTEPSTYVGKKSLDLGFGDGRNMPLLHNLGMHVYGVEISQDICDLTQKRMGRLNIDVTLAVGRNHSIPFDDAMFDIVLACHACYYVDPGKQFNDNIKEVSRVLRPGGLFIFSAPIGTCYIMQGAKDTGDGHMTITNDPYGVRNGYMMKKFDSESEVRTSLAPEFDNFAIGSCRNDFWGVEEHVWIVVCHRKRGNEA